MARFPEAEARLFKRVFVCMRCKRRIKADHTAIMSGKVRCRHCNSKSFRVIKKK